MTTEKNHSVRSVLTSTVFGVVAVATLVVFAPQVANADGKFYGGDLIYGDTGGYYGGDLIYDDGYSNEIPDYGFTQYESSYTPGYSYVQYEPIDYGCYYCGGSDYGYYDTPVYSSQPYSWNWNYNWGFEEETVVIEEYVYEWDYEWDYDDDHGCHSNCNPPHDECSNIPGNQPDGYDCHPDHDREPVCALSASNTSIEEGDSTTLHWTSENATDATLTSFGDVPTGGNRTVSPNSDKTYVLTVRDNDGDTDTCSVTIRVEEEEEDEDVQCELDASDTRVEEGDRITLEWDTEGDVTYASINQGIGRVDEDGGTERVEVDRDTTFRLTVRNDDGDEDTCSVTVRVDEEDVFSSVEFEGEPTYNPPVVYLSDIPYTGLDDVSPAVLSFWVMLIALAGAGTWFVYRQGLIPSFAFASVEPIEEGHEDGHVDEGHATEATPEASAFLSALSAGDTDAAVETLRDAAVTGAGVEETLESASANAPESLKATIDAALAGARETGIRGAKDALGA